jgi:arylsulfatase B
VKKRFFFIRLVGIVSLVGLAVVLPKGSLAAASARPDRPNVVILLADDLGYGEFGHIENLQRRIFAAMLSNLDDSVGAVLAKLHETNLQKRTLVFFLSDNGGPTRELTSSNLPLRGAKGDVYEGGIRVPFMLQWKGQLPEGQVYDQPVISLDIFATAAVAAGAPLPTSRSIDGVDLIPYLTGKKSGRPHEVLFWRMGQRTAVRVGNWKLLRNRRRGQSQWYLYNLADDLAEQNDRALRDADKLAELKRVWEQLNAQMVEPAWQPGRSE